jgi:putative tricarboxylic transport membrane protein
MHAPTRRTAVQGALGALGIAAVTAIAPQSSFAQASRAPAAGPIEITVGTGAGGTPDVVMRQVGKVLNENSIVTNPLVVQNRTGGSWTVAAKFVIGKPGDEHVLLGMAGPIWGTPITQGVDTFYDKVTPIAMFVRGEVAVAVQPDSPITGLKDLIAKAGERERGLKIAGAQVGAVDHIVTGMIEKAGNVKFNYIPFDGGGAAQTAFLGKNSDMIVLGLAEAVELKKQGKIKVLAVLSEQRRSEPEFSDVPTAREQGYDLIWDQTWGLAGPPGLDPAVVKWWDDKLAEMVKKPEWQKMVKDNWWINIYVPSDKVKAWTDGYHQKWKAALTNVGLAKN